MVPSIFFLHTTTPTEIYTLSLHDALPIFELADVHAGREHRTLASEYDHTHRVVVGGVLDSRPEFRKHLTAERVRSEEHTSELQSQSNLVCRLLLEKKKEQAD